MGGSVGAGDHRRLPSGSAGRLGTVSPQRAAKEAAEREGKAQEAREHEAKEREAREARERAEQERAIAQSRLAHCVVPMLKGDTLRAARKALRKANCKLGKVSRPSKHTRPSPPLVVRSQSVPPGRRLTKGSAVAVKLGVAPDRTLQG